MNPYIERLTFKRQSQDENFPRGYDEELHRRSDAPLEWGEHPFGCSCAQCQADSDDN
jgi:hypothetical protein